MSLSLRTGEANRRKHPEAKGVKRQTTATGPSTFVANDDGLHLAYTTPSLPDSFGAVQNLKSYGRESYVNTVRYLSKQDAYMMKMMITFLLSFEQLKPFDKPHETTSHFSLMYHMLCL